MARPNDTRLTQRVQVNVAPSPPPQAGVFAPLTGAATPPKAALNLQSLAQALGVIVDLGAGVVKERDEYFYKQGVADEWLGKADEKLRKRNEAYERGVYEAAVLKQYSEAERSVVEWASRELDRTLPRYEQYAQIDARMKAELADLANDDPNARRLVADRYRTFFEQTANSILEQTVRDHIQLTQDATLADVADDLRKGGDGRAPEAVARLAAVSGDHTKAAEAVLGAYLQVATEIAQNGDIATARGEVERVLSKIPSEIKLSDGTVLRPLDSPSLAASINDAKARAIDMVEKRELEAARESLLDAGKRHIDSTAEGELVPWSWYEGLAKRKVLTMEQALAWYEENQRAFKAKRDKVASDHVLTQWLLDPSKDWRWYVGLTLPDGTVVTEKMFQERFDLLAQEALAKGGPEAFGAVVSLSKSTGIAYTPMKTAMSQLSGDNVETIAQYFPMYQQLRAAGMEGMYVDEKAMPYWMLAEALHQTGVDPTTEKGKAQLRDRLKRYEPERVKQLVAEGLTAVNKKLGSQAVFDNIGPNNTTVDDLDNALYAKGVLRRLITPHLQLGVDPDTALKNGLKQLQMSHSVIEVNDGEKLLLPNERGVDMGELQEALDYFEDEVLPQAAARAGHTKDDVRFEVTSGVGGRGTEIRIVNLSGVNIADGGRFWTPQEVVRMYREATGADEAAEVRRKQRLKSASERFMREKLDQEAHEKWVRPSRKL